MNTCSLLSLPVFSGLSSQVVDLSYVYICSLGPIEIISCLSSENFKKLERGGRLFFFFLSFKITFF